MSKIVWAVIAFAAIGAGTSVAQTAPPSAVPPVPPINDNASAVPAPMDSSMAKPAPLIPAPQTNVTPTASPAASSTPAIIPSTTPPPIGAPLPGANSFTESQARQRMEDQGYSGITDLKQDAQSVWRGTARKGGVAGAGVGVLTGLGLLAIPGVGPVVAAGWLAATVVGAAAGIGAGAMAGGLIGAMTDSGISNDEANVYAEGVRRGTLVTVRVDESRIAAIRAIMARHGRVEHVVREGMYRDSGWTSFDQ